MINGDEVHLDDIAPSGEARTEEATHIDESSTVSEFQVVPPALIEWNKLQQEIINASSEERLLVGAGPGTGKTAVACGRVSQLINHGGLEPNRIWLISFTRAAVSEIRDRIASHLEDAAAAYAVKIATLDSIAWAINSGADDEVKILGSYEENIKSMLGRVQKDENVAEYLGRIEHMIVDEAQDIVGSRADLVVEMIRKLSGPCGVTVFADEAQAIYDFAAKREVQSVETEGSLLPEKIRHGAAGEFRECELTEVHRTGSQKLLKIFSDTRRKVLTAAGDSENKLAEIKAEVRKFADDKAPSGDAAVLNDTFILYRRRSDVLLRTSELFSDHIPHRVRMSGLPVCLAPWIGAALSEHVEAYLTRDTFMGLWADRLHGTPLATCDAADAWKHLVDIAGDAQTIVEMQQLRQCLGRKQPPPELCHAELGVSGPIVGTIHASKGREADTVLLMLPHRDGKDGDLDEESRIVFVGATRGRSRLLVNDGYKHPVYQVKDSGRAYRHYTKDGKRKTQVEVGRDSDIKAEGLAGHSFFENANAVHASQARIRNFVDLEVSLFAERDPDAGFAYRLREDGQDQCLAVLSQSVNKDMFTIADAIQKELGEGKRGPPHKIPYLHVRGVRTIVLPPDAPECNKLHEPWKRSGIMLAPLVLGYSTAFST